MSNDIQTTSPPIDHNDPDLIALVKLCKDIMLVEPLAEMFNSLLIESPVKRIQSVAEAMSTAAEKNPTFKQMIIESGAIRVLRNRAGSLKNGEVVMPEAFLPDLIRQSVSREGLHVA